MRLLICAALLLGWVEKAQSTDYAFAGPWKTTNRKLDGTMTCIITPLANQQWHGHFYGTWQGAPFDYKVQFQGPPDDLRGTTVIDGANYNWRGRVDAQALRANFAGDLYEGSFELKRVKLPVANAKNKTGSTYRKVLR